MILTVRPATEADARWVAHHLRPEDRQEVETATGRAADVAVRSSFRCSEECYSVRLADQQHRPAEHPVMLFGHDRTTGAVWLLGTPEIAKAPVSILREAHRWVQGFAARGAQLWCVADKRNALHLRWLQLLGFAERAVPLINGFPFSYMVRAHV